MVIVEPESYSMTINYTETSNQSSVSDLTGTTWVFNSSIDLSTTGVTPVVDGDAHYKHLTFTSNNRNYIELKVGSTNGLSWNTFIYGDTFSGDSVYMFGSWTHEKYRTISITGGTDATNSDLIAWLEANAVQQVEPTPDVTFDLSTLNLPAGTYTVTVKAEADGFTDSVASNSVTYITDGPAPSTITFIIAGTTYHADEGMTWGEWVASAYNTDGYYVDAPMDSIHISHSVTSFDDVAYITDILVHPSETISPNYDYVYYSGN